MSGNLKIDNNEFSKFATAQQNQQKESSARENEANMQKIQQLMLGDSSSFERGSEPGSDAKVHVKKELFTREREYDQAQLEAAYTDDDKHGPYDEMGLAPLIIKQQ